MGGVAARTGADALAPVAAGAWDTEASGDKARIASSGIIFANTLFDENAASHIAMGQAYASTVRDGEKLSPEQLAAKGANESLIHVDWMIGSDKLDIDAITASGVEEPLMRGGEWV